MDLTDALAFARTRREGALVTLKRDGRAQLSNILYLFGEDGVIRISVTNSRAKTANLRRDPRASLYVPGDTFWAYVVLDATAELSPWPVPPTTPWSTSSSTCTGRRPVSIRTGTSSARPWWPKVAWWCASVPGTAMG